MTSKSAPRWYESLLAAALLVALLAIVFMALNWGINQAPAGADDWRAGSKTTVFLVVLALIVGIGLLAFAIFLIGRFRPPLEAPVQARYSAEPAAYATPSATRLLGLLVLVLAVLLLGWLYLSHEQRYALVRQLLYPASLAVALVLLFDKASRRWNPKSATENFREWLYCDLITFLLLLGFINLMRAAESASYRAFFWDLLYISLFFFAFWMLDRKRTPYRFLVALGYLLLLPLLLLVWRASQAVPAADGSWWETVWPLFFLTLIALVLEIIALLAARHSDNHTLSAIKDSAFFILYGALLIRAIPATGA